MTTKDQLEKVQAHLQNAPAKGAKIAAGVPFSAAPRRVSFIPPVALTNVR